MTTVRSYQNVGEAGFAQSLLEAAGIPAVLEHEGAAAYAPMGVCAVRLQVPEENLAEADQILRERPMHFVDSGGSFELEDETAGSDDLPRFGSWRGGAVGLLASPLVLMGLHFVFPSSDFRVSVPIISTLIGAIMGAKYRLRTPPPEP